MTRVAPPSYRGRVGAWVPLLLMPELGGDPGHSGQEIGQQAIHLPLCWL